MAIEHQAASSTSISLYENIDDLYVQNDSITGVATVLQDFKEVYVSTRDKRSGHILPAEAFKPEANSFGIPVLDPATDQSIGVDLHLLDSEVLYHAIDNTRGHIPMAVDCDITHLIRRFFILVRGSIGNMRTGLSVFTSSWISGSGGSS